MHDGKIEVIYRIDKDGSLVFFNEQWDIFAEENESPHLSHKKIFRESLWDFIHDAETRHFHEILISRVRSSGPVLNLPYRCDSPGLRRFMEMDIAPLEGEVIEYRSRLIKYEQREPMPHIIRESQGDESFLRMCSWCNKIDARENNWMEIEDAISCLDIFSHENIPQVSHTICDTCMAALDDLSD